VPEPWLSKYRGKYDNGYEVLKASRRLLTPIPGWPDDWFGTGSTRTCCLCIRKCPYRMMC
jgi:hypothetical protein